MKQIFTLLLLFRLLSVNGQINQSHRIEIPFKYADENFLLELAGDQGLILFRESKERGNKKENWEILVLDINLEEKLSFNIEVDYKYSIMGYDYSEGNFYLLFKNDHTSKGDFLLVKASIENGEIINHHIANELIIDVSHLLINDESLVMGGYVNFRPTFMVFDYLNDKIEVVPGFFNSKSEVLDFNYDKVHQSYNVLMGQKNALNHNEISLTSFDKNGRILIDERYEFDNNWRALNGRVIIGSNNRVLISGSYATNNSFYSQGFYFGSLVPGKDLSMKYIGFTEIDHFFDYMSPKRASRIKSKIKNSQGNNKPFEFKTHVYVHELREDEGGFLVVSELYSPEFKESSSSVAMGYSELSDRSYSDNTGQKYVNRSSKLTNTDGASHISYHETVVLGLDENGKLLWDQSIPLDEVETLALEQVSQIYKMKEKGVLLYRKVDSLIYKSFDPKETVLSDSSIVINTFQEFDEIGNHTESQGHIQHWYDDIFIVWGYQKINNNQFVQAEKKRNIFFINKLLIE